MGTEIDADIETCLFPWNKDAFPTAEDIFALYHFNPNMHEGLIEDHKYDTKEGVALAATKTNRISRTPRGVAPRRG